MATKGSPTKLPSFAKAPYLQESSAVDVDGDETSSKKGPHLKTTAPAATTSSEERTLLHRVAHFWLLQYVDFDKEPLSSIVRKLVVFCLFIIGICCIFIGGFFTYRFIKRDPATKEDPGQVFTGELMEMITFFGFPMLVAFPSYILMRVRRDVSTGHLATCIMLTMTLVFLSSTGTHVFPTFACTMVTVQLGYGADPGRAGRIVFIIYGHITVTYGILRTMWPDTFMVPNPHRYTQYEGAIFLCFAHMMLASLWVYEAGIHHMFDEKVNEVEKLSLQAQRSSRLAAIVARKLAQYDTEAVRRVLTKFRAKEHDAHLADHFEKLARNLDKYKPHLPMWVLPEAEDTPKEIVLLDEDLDGDEAVMMSESMLMAAEDARSESSVTSSHSHTSAKSKDGASSQLSELVSEVHAFNAFSGAHWGDRHTGGVAMIGFELADRSNAALKSFVVALARVVLDTRGVLHGCVNNTVFVSWGAANTTGRPELAAARCFARLKEFARGAKEDTLAASTKKGASSVKKETSSVVDADRSTFELPKGLVVFGAAFTGPLTARLSGDDKTKLLVVETPLWQRQLDRLFQYAQRHHAFVLDAAVAVPEVVTHCVATFAPDPRTPAAAAPPGVSDDAKAPGVERKQQAKPAGSQPMRVAEVIKERQIDEDEWLYVMQQLEEARQQHAEADPVSEAETLCCQGRFADAVDRLAKLCDPLESGTAADGAALTETDAREIDEQCTAAARYLRAVATHLQRAKGSTVADYYRAVEWGAAVGPPLLGAQ